MDYALVAGGSKGIGYAIAEALAKRKYNLVLIARSKEELQAAKQRLESQYKIHVEILEYDLSMDESADNIGKWCSERNLSLKILCNVAGIGGTQDYLSAPLNRIRYMLRLNLEPAMALTFHLLPLLKKHKPAYILNVASMAGLAPIPEKNIYCAAKSAIIFFSYSLRYQLRKQDISVSCLCPGPVFTKPEIEENTIKELGWFGKQMAVPPAKVGEIAVRKTLQGKMIIVPGKISSVMSAFLRLLPRRFVVYLYYKLGTKTHGTMPGED
jgi:short-subunit dehydrogenase